MDDHEWQSGYGSRSARSHGRRNRLVWNSSAHAQGLERQPRVPPSLNAIVCRTGHAAVPKVHGQSESSRIACRPFILAGVVRECLADRTIFCDLNISEDDCVNWLACVGRTLEIVL